MTITTGKRGLHSVGGVWGYPEGLVLRIPVACSRTQAGGIKRKGLSTTIGRHSRCHRRFGEVSLDRRDSRVCKHGGLRYRHGNGFKCVEGGCDTHQEMLEDRHAQRFACFEQVGDALTVAGVGDMGSVHRIIDADVLAGHLPQAHRGT